MRKTRYATLLGLVVFLVLALSALPASADDIFITNNSGDTSTTWYISDEPSLVINGFDLAAQGITLPVTLNAVRMSVRVPVPGAPVEAVVYQDATGGSPVDATLVGHMSVDIQNAGVFRAEFDPPLTITEPALWIGFYLPVDFKFRADRSGTSVLTWWAWTPGGTFDLTNLSTAAVIGPADGSAPVNIDMKGIARITAELSTPSSEQQAAQNVGTQIVGDAAADTSALQNYQYCGPVFYDTQDIAQAAGDSFDLYCRADTNAALSPTTILPSTSGFEQRGYLFDISAFGDYRHDPQSAEWLRVPVTHCIRPDPADLDTAVIGSGYGAPRVWHILPTVRFGDIICAEVDHIGYLSYFVPRGTNSPPDVNLLFGSAPIISPHPFQCGQPSDITVNVVNNGTQSTGTPVLVTISDNLISDGSAQGSFSFSTPVLGPGESYQTTVQMTVNTNYGKGHRTTITIDPNGGVPELNETDNVWTKDYVLGYGNCVPQSNSNLAFSTTPSIVPNPLQCNVPSTITVNVVNTGGNSTGVTTRLRIEDIRVADGTIQAGIDVYVPPLAGGQTFSKSVIMVVNTYYGETHRTNIVLDIDQAVYELNEGDNTFTQDYILSKASCP